MNHLKKGLSIVRTGTSSYFSNDFVGREQALAQKFGHQYFLENIPESGNLGLITNTHFDPGTLSEQELLRVKWIAHPNSGHDNFPESWVKHCPVPIIMGNSIRAQAVSEYCMQSIQHFCGEAPYQKSWDKDRSWNRRLIGELNVLIVGLGHVGKILSQSLTSYGVEPDIVEPKLDLKLLPKENYYDVICICCEYNDSSHEMVDHTYFNTLKSNGAIINPARGEIINEEHLQSFVTKSPDCSVYLDVHWQEPFAANAWQTHYSNIHCSSHVAGVFNGLEDKMLYFIEQVLSCYDGKEMTLEQRDDLPFAILN
jgi:D-3-phosphoglycerate dehydrogenase